MSRSCHHEDRIVNQSRTEVIFLLYFPKSFILIVVLSPTKSQVFCAIHFLAARARCKHASGKNKKSIILVGLKGSRGWKGVSFFGNVAPQRSLTVNWLSQPEAGKHPGQSTSLWRAGKSDETRKWASRRKYPNLFWKTIHRNEAI